MFSSYTKVSQTDIERMANSGNAFECLFLEIFPERIRRANRINIARRVVRVIVNAIVVVTTITTVLQLLG